jgi:hypothetical protein
MKSGHHGWTAAAHCTRCLPTIAPSIAWRGIGIYTRVAFQRHLSMPFSTPHPARLPSHTKGEGGRRPGEGCREELAQRRQRLEISTENDFLASLCRYQCRVRGERATIVKAAERRQWRGLHSVRIEVFLSRGAAAVVSQGCKQCARLPKGFALLICSDSRRISFTSIVSGEMSSYFLNPIKTPRNVACSSVTSGIMQLISLDATRGLLTRTPAGKDAHRCLSVHYRVHRSPIRSCSR